MAEIQISSQFIRATVSTNGAELKSLYDIETNHEYLWQGDPKYWNRSSPLLFPIVGQLKEEKYRIGNKFYNLPRHGFARDSEFELITVEDDFVHLRLGYCQDTLKIFPFKFTLDVTFKVYGPKIFVNYEVNNIDRREILFSIGSHPAFNVPIGEQGRYEDYYIEFEHEEAGGAFYLEKGLVNFHTFPDRSMFKGTKKIPLTNKLFENDALIFKDIHSSKFHLKNKSDARSVTVEVEDVPYLGLWAPVNAPFVCIEPWHGVSDGVDSNFEFLEKEGLLTLDPSKCFKTGYSIFIN